MAKLLFIADTFPPNIGGSEASLEIMAVGLAKMGHQIQVYTPWPKVDEVPTQLHPNISVRRSQLWLLFHDGGSSSNPMLNRLSRALIYPFLFLRLLLTSGDVIIAGHVLPAGIVAHWLISAGRWKRLIVTTYGEDVTMYKQGSRMLRMLRYVLMHSDVVSVTTQMSKTELDEVFPGVSSKTAVIPPAVRFNAQALKSDIVDKLTGSPIILTLARLVERKGIDVTISAVALLKDHFPEIKYYVAGRGPDLPRLQSLVDELDVGENVIFLGPVTDPDQIFPQCDIFCMPNRMLENGEREGFGMVFLEAGLHSIPSIAGRSGGAIDAVLHEKTGLLITPTDVHGIADAIRTLADRPHYRNQLGAAAKLHAQQFTEEKMYLAYHSIIQDLLK